MEPRKGNKNSRSKGSHTSSQPKGGKAKTGADSNQRRRKLYNSDVDYREKAKKRSRDTYRKGNPIKKKATNPIVDPKNKEVITKGVEHPIFVEVFTIPEAAKYLGRSVITFKRWITDKMLPPPILACTSHGYLHYSIGELQLIARIIKDHEKGYEYLHHTHEATINQLWQNLEAYRKSQF